jgi:hypothetical protein
MKTESQTILISASVQKAAHSLLDHQCWVLGKDVSSPCGNLLCEYGFKPIRCPQGGLTQYELNYAIDECSHIYLWGFGVYFGNEVEGIFVGRNDFKPRQTFGYIELHSKEDPGFRTGSPRLKLLLEGINWFAKYERWIANRMPAEWQENSLTTFPRKSIPRSEFARHWEEIAHCIEIDSMNRNGSSALLTELRRVPHSSGGRRRDWYEQLQN